MPAAPRRARTAPPKKKQKKKSRGALRNARSHGKPNQKKTKRAANRLAVDVLVEAGGWNDFTGAATIVGAALAAAVEAVSTPRAELAIVLTDDSAVRELNRTWRGIDAATNVLSFPAPRTPAGAPHLGDIVLAWETVAAEAKAQRKPFAHHLAHLAVHGFLHLLGYDHESNKDALVMEQIERNILQRLAIPDPYRQSAKDRI